MTSYFHYLPLLITFSLPTFLFGQNTVVKGLLHNAENDQPVAFANVLIYSSTDSTLLNGALSKQDGSFSITNISSGQFYIEVRFIGYKEFFTDTFTIPSAQKVYNYGTIELQPDKQTLGEVEITAERNQMEFSLDKRVYNAEQDLNIRGGSAEDLLNNVPSVQVDIDGGITLRGSGNVRILINGKPSGLVGTGSSGLRQIPASMIERVEVITNPSAKYDAEGEAGIINIILKKEKKRGFNGSFELNGGLPGRLGAAANMNYRKEHFNFFANYGINYRKNPGYGFSNQTFTPEDTTYYTDVRRDHIRGGISNSIRLGTDVFLGNQQTLTGSFLYKYSKEQNNTTLSYRDYDINRVLMSTIRREDAEIETESDLEWQVNYEKIFNDDDHKLTANVRYVLSDETEDSEIEEFTNSGTEPALQDVLNQEYERNIIGNIDYLRPLGNKRKLEMGWRSTMRNINNPYTVEDYVNGKWERLDNFSNSLFYTENVHAAYTMYGQERAHLSYQVGLRAEYTQMETYLEEGDERYPRDYFNLFPSAHITYKLSKANAFQASYSRRINRPGFWSLNPFYSFTNPRNFRAGNPNLNPEFTHSLEGGHMFYWAKGSLLSSIYYRNTTGVIERITTVTGENTTVSLPVNLSTRNAYGFEFNYSHKIWREVRLTANANLYRELIDGVYEGQNFSSDAYTVSGRANAQFTIWKDLDGQLSFNYRGPRRTPQGFRQAIWHSDLGFAKDVLKGKGTINLSVRDLFNTRKRRSSTETADFYEYGEFQWRQRTAMFSFTYRINQQKRRNTGIGRDDADGGE